MTDLALVDTSTGEVMARHGGPLALLAQAREALERSRDLGEIRVIRDSAEAVRHYVAAAGMGLELQNEAAEIKLRAERRAGELLARAPVGPGIKSATLADFGVLPGQSSRWQRIASLPVDDFEAHIASTKQASRELTTSGVLKLAKQYVAADKPDAPPVARDGTWQTIVIDPPWQYSNVATRGAAEDHYPTMSIAELCELELPAAENAHLYLWVTNGFLREAFNLVDAWGFTYKTCLTWVKPQIGMGNWFRNATEHVYFAVKGKLPTARNDVPTWFKADRTQHSAKPESFYDLVETCSPGPWLEMFARRRRMGWDVWGNEA